MKLLRKKLLRVTLVVSLLLSVLISFILLTMQKLSIQRDNQITKDSSVDPKSTLTCRNDPAALAEEQNACLFVGCSGFF